MKIDTSTKVIGRFHRKLSGTGLNIYNPYFQENNINAVYVLFQNEDPSKLLGGMKLLNLAGAITAGFETDPQIAELADSLTEYSKLAGRVGVIRNNEGSITAHYQGGIGLLNAITEKYDINEKRIVLVGAGTVAKTFLLAIKNTKLNPSQITILNRTVENANKIKDICDKVKLVQPLESIDEVSGDILVNASEIGSNEGDMLFSSKVVDHFEAVADVTFGKRDTCLIVEAEKQGKLVIDGWDMFTHQAAEVLKYMLDHDANIASLRKHVVQGLGK